jgi:hypothetical protein
MTENPLFTHPASTPPKELSRNSAADVLAGMHSRQSLHALDDPERKSRLDFASSFNKRFHDFENPSNSKALTTFLLLNTMIGSGILNQPYVFYESGFVGGVSST